MLKDLKEVESRLNKLPPIQQNIVASHIWWKLCNRRSVEDMATIKEMINYNGVYQSPEVIEDALTNFGFTPDYAERVVKSLRTLLKYRAEVLKRL